MKIFAVILKLRKTAVNLPYTKLNSHKLITTTTHSPRAREIDGQDYYFVSKAEFWKGITNNRFLEYMEYNNIIHI